MHRGESDPSWGRSFMFPLQRSKGAIQCLLEAVFLCMRSFHRLELLGMMMMMMMMMVMMMMMMMMMVIMMMLM